jgi:hypothetical protein
LLLSCTTRQEKFVLVKQNCADGNVMKRWMLVEMRMRDCN